MTDDADAGSVPTGKGRGRRKLLLAAVGAVVMVGGAIGGAFALGLLGGETGVAAGDAHDMAAGDHGDAHDAATTHGAAAPGALPLFVDLPDLLVNLAVGDGRPRFLKLSIAVEVADTAAAERIGQLSPRIVDSFQMYLRTLTPGELQTPGAMFRLKEDLHVRIHQAIAPQQVADVLFKEMLVQ